MPTRRVSDAIDAIGFGPAQIYVEILAHGVWLADGIEMTMVTALTASIGKDLNLTKMEMASLTSIVFFGIACGCAMSGYLGDNIGRRSTVLCCYTSVVILGSISVLIWDFAALVIVRLLLGIAMGVGMPTSLVIVSEMSPVAWRIPLMGMRGVVFSLGNVIACGILLMDDPTLASLSWRTDSLLAKVPPLILGALAFVVLPESPVFLEANGRREDAQRVLTWIMRRNGVDQLDEDSMYVPDAGPLSLAPSASAVSDERKSWSSQIRALFSRHLGYCTCTLLMSAFSLNFVEYGSAYAEPRVLQETHADLAPGWQLLCKYTVNIAVRCFVIFPATVLSRRVALTSALIYGCVVGILLFAWTGGMENRTPFLETLYYSGQYLPLLGVSLALIVTFQLSVEIYPTWVTATGSACILACGRVAAIIAPFVFEYMQFHWQNFYYTMATICGTTAVFVMGLANLDDLATAAKEDTMDSFKDVTFQSATRSDMIMRRQMASAAQPKQV